MHIRQRRAEAAKDEKKKVVYWIERSEKRDAIFIRYTYV